MQSFTHGAIPPSYTTTSVALGPDVPGTTDDHSIAEALLNNSRKAVRRASFTNTAGKQYELDGLMGRDGNADLVADQAADSRTRRGLRTSNTWTSSSGDMATETDEIEDRSIFVLEYNRLATKHGVRIMARESHQPTNDSSPAPLEKQPGWLRKFLRRTSSNQSMRLQQPERQLRHKRSISDISLRLKRSKKDRLKDKDLQELVRICGSSLLYLPPEYAVGSLSLPTCFRATLQYLVQHAPKERGVFRVPGSTNSVAQLYNHYCELNDDGSVIAGTVRCPTLPSHIEHNVHDVASAFKKMLSGLPGGILGSLTLFDTFVSIQTQLHPYPESTRTRQSKVKARLIALALATIISQYRRELICAVFGLLSMVGRHAETTKREDDHGRPLPTHDLMGYVPLGIVFGPLLIGDLVESYTMQLTRPNHGLILLPISPVKSKKEKQKKVKGVEDNPSSHPSAQKAILANSVTEMLITHWRDVVRHMKSLHSLKASTSGDSLDIVHPARLPYLRPSVSESFALRKPPDWDDMKLSVRRHERSMSPTPRRRLSGPIADQTNIVPTARQNDTLGIRKQRLRPGQRPVSNHGLSGARSMSILSPTTEEHSEGESFTENSSSTPYKTRPGATETFSELSTPSKSSRKEATSACPTVDHKCDIAPPTSIKKSGHASRKLIKKSPSSTSNYGNKKSHAATEVSHGPKNTPIDQASALSGSTETTLPEATNRNPYIKISEVLDVPQPTVSGLARRLTASDPVQPLTLAVSSRRRVSKTVCVDSRGNFTPGKAFSRPTARDPLSSISKEDDIASLAALARALADETPGSSKPPDNRLLPATNASSGTDSEGAISSPQMRSLIIRQGSSDTRSPNKTSQSRQLSERWGDMSNDNTPIQLASMESKNSSSETVLTTRPQFDTSSNYNNAYTSPAGLFSSPVNSVKVLAAKFDKGDSCKVLDSPTKLTPRKALGARTDCETRKESVVALYTSNPPSPTRSQKSTKSDKALFSSRRPTELALSKSRPNIPSPVTSFLTLPSGNVSSNSTNISTAAGGVPNDSPSNCTWTPVAKSVLTGEQPDKLDSSTGKSPRVSLLDKASPPNNPDDLSLFRPVRRIGHESKSHNDRESKLTNTAVELSQPAKSLHVHFGASESKTITNTSNSVRSSLFKDISSGSDGQAQLVAPPIRSNSVLHSQIRSLHAQVSDKAEEIRQLRQQLAVRSNLDIGTLSEQLRESKQLTEFWKRRAEVAEKQIEMLTKMPTKSNSVQNVPSQFVNRYSDLPISSKRFHHGEHLMTSERKQKALHGMDGTTGSSVGSTETVVRDFREAITGSEYSIWVQQTMSALDSRSTE